MTDDCDRCDNSYAARTLSGWGAGVGGYVQNKLQKKWNSFFSGSGDYSLQSNSLVNGGGVATQSVNISSNGRETRVVYKEYLQDIYTNIGVTGAFDILSFPINPGQIKTFPWLSALAGQFEQWRPNGILFEFVGTASEYSTTFNLGSVIMATEYDVGDGIFQNKAEMLRTAYSNQAPPTKRIVHGIECNPNEMPNSLYFTRMYQGITNPGITPVTDFREYDIGLFSIATERWCSSQY